MIECCEEEEEEEEGEEGEEGEGEEVGDIQAQLGVDYKILCIYLQKLLHSLMDEFHIYQSG